jgi:hypothetical protein
VEKTVLPATLAFLFVAVAASALWFHARMPPNCTDPATIALVRQSLIARDHLPAGTTLDNIRTVAGGLIALRFVCQAQLGGFDPHTLPPGMPLSGLVTYTSQWATGRRRLEVTVELQPLMKWEKVQ